MLDRLFVIITICCILTLKLWLEIKTKKIFCLVPEQEPGQEPALKSVPPIFKVLVSGVGGSETTLRDYSLPLL